MMNVGIQCCKRNDVSVAVRSREKIRVDPFGSNTHIFSYVSVLSTVTCTKRFVVVSKYCGNLLFRSFCLSTTSFLKSYISTPCSDKNASYRKRIARPQMQSISGVSYWRKIHIPILYRCEDVYRQSF